MDDSCCMCMGHIHDLHQMGHDQNFSFDVYLYSAIFGLIVLLPSSLPNFTVSNINTSF